MMEVGPYLSYPPPVKVLEVYEISKFGLSPGSRGFKKFEALHAYCDWHTDGLLE
jgi:hypothetical protein